MEIDEHPTLYRLKNQYGEPLSTLFKTVATAERHMKQKFTRQKGFWGHTQWVSADKMFILTKEVQ